MTTVRAVYDFLDAWAPFSTAMSFDNAGLLAGNGKEEVRRAVLALDITPAAARSSLSAIIRSFSTRCAVCFPVPPLGFWHRTVWRLFALIPIWILHLAGSIPVWHKDLACLIFRHLAQMYLPGCRRVFAVIFLLPWNRAPLPFMSKKFLAVRVLSIPREAKPCIQSAFAAERAAHIFRQIPRRREFRAL